MPIAEQVSQNQPGNSRFNPPNDRETIPRGIHKISKAQKQGIIDTGLRVRRFWGASAAAGG